MNKEAFECAGDGDHLDRNVAAAPPTCQSQTLGSASMLHGGVKRQGRLAVLAHGAKSVGSWGKECWLVGQRVAGKRCVRPEATHAETLKHSQEISADCVREAVPAKTVPKLPAWIILRHQNSLDPSLPNKAPTGRFVTNTTAIANNRARTPPHFSQIDIRLPTARPTRPMPRWFRPWQVPCEFNFFAFDRQSSHVVV